MPIATLLSLISFAFVTAMTPGPNNIMLTASGVNFGFKRTIPHMGGIAFGFFFVLLAAGLGIGALFAAYPQAQLALKLVGVAYMLWLAWKVASPGFNLAGDIAMGREEKANPLTVLEAALFQWVNPKALLIAFSAVSLYVRAEAPATDVPIVIAVFMVFCFISVAVWAGFGAVLRNFLRNPKKVRVFNIVMALLLVASIVPMIVT